ncbi:SGNH/GDSL hydrolase family protein [Patescibacteria group bacterium]|nr:SGNH/GDSL hydrolase family protein [Patescibacteria group bacterium]MDE1946440.1 SGNH/GDSL hydrolase family protein [Patescibacteria group bacterium]MDE2011048.1 SGNH/GDSL hydrolase family protein [Patescibacteria group bacterium]MDE2233527.1 SGNH/GDSL hydrolase family protein [Patescibacteria group bacterium]
MAVIYAFGDSITYGAWDIKNSGWATRLRAYLDDIQEKNPNYYGLFYNLGIPGETTDGLVKRFENETNAREREGEEAVFIFAFGANDAAFLAAQNKFRVSKEDFWTNLETVIKKALDISKNILIVNILPVIEVMNRDRNGKTRSNKYMEEYNQVLKQLADQFGLRFVDAYSLFIETGHEKLFIQDDGLHPNDKGHELMFNAIRPVVQEMIGWK